ncbi:MAG TPA: hypothetical protein VJU58_04000 [Microbacterium sp.]|nr:hypothetical protein [Microbacterium sp.]
MSRNQTRRSISLTRELHDRLFTFAAEHRMPAAQVVTQAIEAVLRGDVKLAPAADPSALARETSVQRGSRPGVVWKSEGAAQPAAAPDVAPDDESQGWGV